jgi:hypothetical protein
MKQLKRILLGILMGVMVAESAFAQKNSNDNRPPKDPPPKIIERPKPPPSNTNSNSNTNKKKPG